MQHWQSKDGSHDGFFHGASTYIQDSCRVSVELSGLGGECYSGAGASDALYNRAHCYRVLFFCKGDEVLTYQFICRWSEISVRRGLAVCLVYKPRGGGGCGVV